MNYSITNLKTFIGREGHGFNATLLRDGVPVAQVRDMADGGPHHFDWLDRATKCVKGKRRDHGDKVLSVQMTPEEKLFEAYVLELPKDPDYGMWQNADMAMSTLVGRHEAAKGLAKRLRLRILVKKLDGRIYACPPAFAPTPENIARAAKAAGVVAVLNSLPIEAALDAYLAN